MKPLNRYAKLLIIFVIALCIAASTCFIEAFASESSYKVQPGESYWSISHKLGIPYWYLMKINEANEAAILYVGQTIRIPVIHIAEKGESYWSISRKYGVNFNELLELNKANLNSVLKIGDKVIIPIKNMDSRQEESKPYVTYEEYVVVKNDTIWSVAIKYGIPVDELIKVNNLSSSSVLYIGQKLRIPVHHIPVKPTPGEKFGEYLDWWSEAQYVVPVGAVFEVIDFYTGKSFLAKRTTGTNHADCEPDSLNSTQNMKDIWGGSFSWERRPVIIKYNGRKIAASVSAMPHAGDDKVAGGVYTTWRSGDYGAGYNLDWVKNNGCDGVIDIHFLNSTRHMDGKMDPEHQKCVRIAAGME